MSLATIKDLIIFNRSPAILIITVSATLFGSYIIYLMLRKGFFFAPKGKKTASAPRLNTTMQVENHNIEAKTSLVRHISYLSFIFSAATTL